MLYDKGLMTTTVPTARPVRTTRRKTPLRATTKTKLASITNYKSALAFLSSFTNYESAKRYLYNEKNFGLKRMSTLLDLVGNPQKKFRSVHIAGTKGKGSTCTMLSQMLIANDLKVGLYTSPHVMDLRERIQINSKMISEAAMVKVMKKVATAVRKMLDDPPSFFEILTAMAFLYFATEKVDVAIVETGLGGRLDSTNVIDPEVIGITSISLDHQQQLGRSPEMIAVEKAGVFKKGVPVISVKQDPEVIRVLKQSAERTNSSIKFTGKEIDYSCRFESSRSLGPHNRICLTTATSRFEHLPVPVYGEHQALNCGLALSLLDELRNKGFAIDDERAIEGLAKTELSGRMEIVCQDPRVLIDGAHNAASIRVLIRATGQHIPYDSMVVIFGCCEDKDVEGMLRELQYGADKVIFTSVKSPRTVQPEELAQRYTEICGKMCQVARNLNEAIRVASSAITNGDLICVTGSFYLVGEAKTKYQANASLMV
jgi:dihydrofolate synthase/folylpolyglutamate synthase